MYKIFSRKKIPKIIPVIALGFLIIPTVVSADFWDVFGVGADGLAGVFGWIAINVVLKIASLLTFLSGAILNFVIKYTVVDMAKNITASEGTINYVWGVIRDLANMSFIFILLFASIKLILGTGEKVQKTIVNVIMVAILINFSLFGTKVVIDFSNLLAVTFYGAIAPGALDDNLNGGLSNSLMEPLKIGSLLDASDGVDLSGTSALVIGVMGSVVAIIAAFVFFSVTIMFIIRFVVLIFVMLLSPIALLGLVLPQMKGTVSKWTNALIGQSFFAPIYFFMTWIVIVLVQGIFTDGGTSLGAAFAGVTKTSADGTVTIVPSIGGITALMNFAIVIAMIIASLIVAKDVAGKAGPGVKGITKWATGAAGSATFGTLSFAGRRTLGVGASKLSDNEKLKERASRSGLVGAASRLTLATSRKTAGATFDARGTKLGKTLDAGKARKGGYTDDLKKAAEKKKKFGESLGPSDIHKADAKQELEDIKNINIESKETTQQRESAVLKAKTERTDKEEKYIKVMIRANRYQDAVKKGIEKDNPKLSEKYAEEIKAARKDLEDTKRMASISDNTEYKKILQDKAKERIDKIDGVNEDEAKKRIKAEKGLSDEELKKYLKEDEGKANLRNRQQKGAGDLRKEAYAKAITEENWIGQNQVPFLRIIKKSHKQAAAELRKGKKSVKEELESILKANKEISDKVDDAVEDAADKADDTSKPDTK